MQFIPRTRSGDPETSHEAEAFMRKSGAIRAQYREVLAFVRSIPGLTAREYDERVGAFRGIYHRRLVEMERIGMVRRGEVRKCSRGGRSAATWYPVEQKSEGPAV